MSSSFDDVFLNILTRRLLESQTRLWPSTPEDEASQQSRQARLVGLVDRTRVFTKVLRESFEGSGSNNNRSKNCQTEENDDCYFN